MSFKNEYTMIVDIKRSVMTTSIPTYVKNDTTILYIKIQSDGQPYDYSTADRYIVTFKRRDGQIVEGSGVYENGLIKYTLGSTEMALVGNLEATVQLYLGSTRITTRPFTVSILEDFEDGIPSTQGYSVLQQLFIDVDTALTNMENAETTRQNNEATRQNNETTRQSQESQRQTNTTDAISRLDSSVNNLKLNYKAPVANFAAIGTTYTTPSVGDIVQTTDDGKFYRYNGSVWEWTQQITGTAITDLQNKVGNLTTLSTTDKTNLVSATNELHNEIGVLSNLTTTDKTSLVNAVNETVSQLAQTVNIIDNEIDFKWNTGTSVSLVGVNAKSPLLVNLNGLYFRGKHLSNNGQKIVKITSNLVANWSSGGLDAGTIKTDNWYGVFLVRNTDGTAALKFVSFLRVLSDSTNVLSFSKHRDKAIAQDYGFLANDLVGCEFVVLNNGVTEGNIGEVRSVTANNATSITYDGASLGLSQGSFVMIAPKGYTDYKYVGAVYADVTPELLNFTKSGKKYDSLGSTFLSGGTAGTKTQVDASGYFPPTARLLKLRMVATSINSPAAGGNFGITLDNDNSNHTTLNMVGVTQNITAQQTMAFVGEIIPRFPLQLWYEKISSNTASVNLQCYGWEE